MGLDIPAQTLNCMAFCVGKFQGYICEFTATNKRLHTWKYLATGKTITSRRNRRGLQPLNNKGTHSLAVTNVTRAQFIQPHPSRTSIFCRHTYGHHLHFDSPAVPKISDKPI